MQQPTENVVAQVEWLFTKSNKPLPPISYVSVPRLYEANAIEQFFNGDWSEALGYARQWLADQPFSSRPADLASYSASLLGRYKEAVSLLESARASNPDDQMIINNLAYFSVLDGDISGGERWMRSVDRTKLSELEKSVINATAGLIKFRLGDVAGGREAYEEAVKEGRRLRSPRIETIALINLSREERRAGNLVRAEELRKEARSAAKRTHEPDITTMLERLESGVD